MFKVRLHTQLYRPDLQITIRAQQWQNWQEDLAGQYINDAWEFVLDDTDFAAGFTFKFVLEKQVWMAGNDLFLQPQAGAAYDFDGAQIFFPPLAEAIIQNSAIQQKFLVPQLDENILHDVIVIGSGIGGGIVAEQAADLGLKVLLLELGSYLFPTHIGNLPRRHRIAKQVDKHIWGLWDDFKTINYVNTPDSTYGGGQGFCLGGRSVFWGGFIPRMTWWEMDDWPQDVRWYLEDYGYAKAEQLLKKSLPQSTYQGEVLNYFERNFRDYLPLSAPMAVDPGNQAENTLSSGVFSTADLLLEAMLSPGPTGNANLAINLNHAVTQLHWEGNRITGVTAYDLLAGKQRTYKGKNIVLSAGTVESAKLAKLSNLKDPQGLVGKGITDHPIYYTHFALPANSPLYRSDAAAKFILRHRHAGETDAQGQPQHRYNVLIELGADFNQGRYVDPEALAAMQAAKDNSMLCEIVFLFHAPLVEGNQLNQNGPSFVKPQITMQAAGITAGEWEEINGIQTAIFNALGAQALPGEDLAPKLAGMGGVAHEVGSLRMGDAGAGVVDTQLKYQGYENLYVCDLSVFPASPAANPTLTLAALALRLSDHLREQM